jgi:hypothetical protein
VVSPTKLALLHVATMGLYGVYWFYRHWRDQKLAAMPSIWPLPRAIFSVFYAAPLFKALDLDARTVGHAPTWNPAAHAAVFIVVNVAARVLDKVSELGEGSRGLALVALLLPLLATVPLLTAQKVVNLSVGDPGGRSNSQLGAGGIVVVLAGGAFWLLVIVGTFMPV